MTDQPSTQDDAATVNIDLLVRHRIPHMHPPDVVGWCRCWLHDDQPSTQERCPACGALVHWPHDYRGDPFATTPTHPAEGIAQANVRHVEALVAEGRSLRTQHTELETALREHHANVWAHCAVCESTVGVQSEKEVTS